jgi:hypothetical protein
MLRHATGALRRVAARRRASTLVLADHDGANMTPSTLAALTAASKLNEKSAVLVAGAPSTVAEQASKAAGVEAVFHVEAPPSATVHESNCRGPHLTHWLICTQVGQRHRQLRYGRRLLARLRPGLEQHQRLRAARRGSFRSVAGH